jgi:hypothetical protein
MEVVNDGRKVKAVVITGELAYVGYGLIASNSYRVSDIGSFKQLYRDPQVAMFDDETGYVEI